MRFRPPNGTTLAGVLVAVVTVGVVLSSTASKGAYGSDADASLAVRSLSRQMRHNLGRDEPYVMQIVEPVVGSGVMWDLVRHGYDIPAPAADPYFGPTHSPPRGTAVAGLYVIDRVTPFPRPPGSKVVASYGGTHEHAAERGLQRVCRDVTDHPPAVTALGRSLIGTLPPDVRQAILRIGAGAPPPCTPALIPGLRGLLGFGLVTLPGVDTGEFTAVQTLLDEVARAGRDVVLAPRGSSPVG